MNCKTLETEKKKQTKLERACKKRKIKTKTILRSAGYEGCRFLGYNRMKKAAIPRKTWYSLITLSGVKIQGTLNTKAIPTKTP